MRLLNQAELLVKDSLEQIILPVYIRSREIPQPLKQEILQALRKSQGKIPFLMLVSLDNICIYSPKQSAPVASWKTADILEFYEPKFLQKRILPNYLMALVEAWLNDLAYHWKSPNPPGTLALKNLGLLDKLINTSTERNN